MNFFKKNVIFIMIFIDIYFSLCFDSTIGNFKTNMIQDPLTPEVADSDALGNYLSGAGTINDYAGGLAAHPTSICGPFIRNLPM